MKKSALEKRNSLKRLCFNPRKRIFKGVFQKFGQTTFTEMFPDKTVCFTSISLDGNEVAEHLWIRQGQINNTERLKGLRLGDIVEFEALPYSYIKEARNKIVSEKYSLGDVTILNVSKVG